MAAATAAEYAERYRKAFETNSLTQSVWHAERDGRQLACALGVIGEDVDEPRKCPAQIMPRWLAQMVPALFDRQREADAFLWGLEFTDALARLDGQVPFSVIHDTYDPRRETYYVRSGGGGAGGPDELQPGEWRNANGICGISRRCVYGYWRLAESASS